MENAIQEEKINYSMPVTVYGALEKYNSVISKARVRIFYKGFNRNGTYISDEFAEKLLSSLSYSPVCGIYQDNDFTDHGEARSESKAYGVVPENPNIRWEFHLDEDGIEREYACADVYLWTARYKEALEIPGKSHSMELYDKSIKGIWRNHNGKRYFEYTEGSFIGLTPLGDSVEPCFEGAAFYSLIPSLVEMAEELQKYNKEKGGSKKMEINFKLSDREKHEAIWKLLNPNFNEEHDYEIQCCIMDIYDDYALIYNYEDESYYRVRYQKDDETDSVELGNREKTYIMDISESELSALKGLKTLNNNSFEYIDRIFSENLDSLEQYKSQKEIDDNTISSLQEDKEKLEKIVFNKEKEEKEKIISQYNEMLSEDELKEFSEKIDTYSINDLKKDLALKLVESKPSIFSKEQTPLIPQDYNDNVLSPASKALKRYMNKKNNINGGQE